MKSRNKIIAAVATATTLAIALPLFAQAQPMGGFDGGCDAAMEGRRHGMHGRHHGMRGDHHGMMGRSHDGMMGGERMLRGLNLSEAQRDKLFELRHEQAPALRAKWKEVRAARRALSDLAWSGEYSEAKAQQLAVQAAQAMSEIATMRAQLNAGIYAALDDTQRAALQERRSKMQQRRMGGGAFGPSAQQPEEG